MIKARLEWATLELECDRLQHELKAMREREEALERAKYEESLKRSILEKETEIAERIRLKELERKKQSAVGHVVKKGLGKLWTGFGRKQAANVKESKDTGVGCGSIGLTDEERKSGIGTASARAYGFADDPGHGFGSHHSGPYSGQASTGIGGGTSNAASSKRSEQ